LSVSTDLVCELLRQSLAAWSVAGRVERVSDGALLIHASKSIRVEKSPHAVFRWTVTIDGRTRGALSLVAVLRQVREALDPGYAPSRVRVAATSLVPSQ
jgi:hypothetical protein